MSIEVMELFDIFSGTFGKEKAQVAVKDIETLISDHKQELATKEDILEMKRDIQKAELRIEQAKTSVIKWVSSWILVFVFVQAWIILAILMLFKK